MTHHRHSLKRKCPLPEKENHVSGQGWRAGWQSTSHPSGFFLRQKWDSNAYPFQKSQRGIQERTVSTHLKAGIWPVLVGLNLHLDSLKRSWTLWVPPAAEVNKWDLVSYWSESEGAPGGLSQVTMTHAVQWQKLCPAPMMRPHRPNRGSLDGVWGMSASLPSPPLLFKTGIKRLQSASHTPAPGGLCLYSEPFHLPGSWRRLPNW